MNREQKIEAIYDKVADKILNPLFNVTSTKKHIYSQVRIWDVLDYLEKDVSWINYSTDKTLLMVTIVWLLNRWKEKRKPLEEQSDETIDYLFNLIIW